MYEIVFSKKANGLILQKRELTTKEKKELEDLRKQSIEDPLTVMAQKMTAAESLNDIKKAADEFLKNKN